MKSKTSFFNGSVLRKDITRFMPVWALYTIFLLMCTVLSLDIDSGAASAATVLSDLIPPMTVLNLIYAAVCAASLFGDLYVPKMCNALHAMPMRRESWFLTHTVAGLLFSLIPNLLLSLISLTFLKEYYAAAFVWLGAVTLQYLFFFGLALFCTLCAGNRLGMVATYGILNFLSVFLIGLVQLLYVPLLYGISLNADPFLIFCPVLHMSSIRYVGATVVYDNPQWLSIEGYVASSWNYLYILAAIGILFAVFAVLLYRRRQLERAGDLLAVSALSPLFLLIITLGCGMAFYFFAMLFTNNGSYLFLFAGTVVGFFAARMLVERTVKIFNRKSVVGYLVIAALVGASLCITYLDPMGLVSKVPDESDVVCCTFTADYRRNDERIITDPEEIRQIQDFHRELLKNPPATRKVSMYGPDGSDFTVNISYELKNGSHLYRQYTANSGTEVGKAIGDYMSDWRVVLGTNEPENLAEHIYSANVNLWKEDKWGLSISNQDIAVLLDAVKADCEAGHMAQHHAFHDNENQTAYIEIFLDTDKNPGLTERISVDVYESCENTMKVLRELAKDMPSNDPYF